MRRRDRPAAGSARVGAGRAPRASVLGLLLCVLCLGALLRFHQLDAQSLWNDELSTWVQSHHETLAEVIEVGVRPTPYPPGFQILIWWVERHVGESEVALRMPSAVAGVLAILAIFLLGREMYGEREGLLAAAVLAVSYQPLYYSQEARAYSLLLLSAIVSGLFWLRVQRALEGGGRPGVATCVAYVASAGAMMYLHYFGLLLAVVQVGGLLALFALRPRALAWAAGLAAALAALYLPWLPHFLEEFGSQPVYLPVPGLGAIARHWRWLFYDPTGALAWATLAVFAVAIGRWLWLRRRRAERGGAWRALATSPTALLTAWLVVPFAFAFVRSLTSAPILNDRNLIIGLPAAHLLFARAITTALPRPALQLAAAGAVAALMLHGIFVTGAYYDFPRKNQFREAAAVVAAHEARTPDARVVAWAWNRAYFDYYLARQGSSLRVDLVAGAPSDVPVLREFLARERPRHLWVLVGHRILSPEVTAWLERELAFVAHQPLFGAAAILYRVPRAGDAESDRAPPTP